MLARAYKLARMDLKWQLVEPAGACGTYNFSAYDTLLSVMKTAGVRPYWILDYSNTCYSPYPGCNTSACITGYGNFAAATVNHFKGNGIIFESVNEANGMGHDDPATITAMALAAGPHFKAAGEIWVGPTTAGIDFGYLNATFALGILDAYTAVSVHPYRSTAPETALDDYVALRQLIASYMPKGQTPLEPWSGEWGYTSAGPQCNYGNKQPRQYQAAYLARMWLTNTLANIGISINYDWKNDGLDPEQCEQNFGSVYAPYTGNVSAPFIPKPKYTAALTLQNSIGNSPALTGRITPSSIVPPPGPAIQANPEDFFILQFAEAASGGRDGFAVWTNGSLAADNECSATPSGSNVIDCGFYGISHGECSSRGCCWVDNPVNMPQCYRSVFTTCSATASIREACASVGANATEASCLSAGCCYDEWAPTGTPTCFQGAEPTAITFTLPSVANTCFNQVTMLGEQAGRVCADATGKLALNVTDRPLYLL